LLWIIKISALGLVGFVLTFWARPLPLRYNAWTTGVRERHPHINPPPTPEMRALNTKIMTIMFRVLGVLFLLLSIVGLLGTALSR
jgi:hypothetical protein